MKKYFLLIQPNDFYNPERIESIEIKGYNGLSIYSGKYNAKIHLEIKKMLISNALFITYNGDLLNRMIWQFFGFIDYKNIIDLMEIFAIEYGKIKDWETEDGSLYIWQKLTTALNYYRIRGIDIERNDCEVNIYDSADVLNKTVILYYAMKAYEENFKNEGVS